MTGKVVGSRWNVQVNMLGYTLDNTIYGETLEVSKPLLESKKKTTKKSATLQSDKASYLVCGTQFN